MSDMVKIRVHVGTGYPSAKHEDIWAVEREWWESLSKEEQEKELDSMAIEYLWNCVECNAWVMEDDDE